MKGINHILNLCKRRNIKISFCAGLLFFMNISILPAQQKTVGYHLPLDPSIRQGQLANGFTYFIKNIKKDSQKIYMHLIVKTGNIHQKQNQLNFAHALEHLAFKCAPNFPENLLNNPELLIQYDMEKRDVFGYTRTMYTSYNFNIPRHNFDAMRTGLLWFRDISNLQLTNEKIETERGPLRQEAIYKLGSKIQRWYTKSNMESQLFPFKLDYSNFFDHNQNFSSDSLKAFYKKWYQPDRMALVIVGNINNIGAIEKKIKSKFSDLRGHSKTWVDSRIEHLEKPNQFITVEQEESKINSNLIEFHLYLRDNKILKEPYTWKSLQREIIWSMLSSQSLLNDRFKEASKKYNTSFAAYGHADISVHPVYKIKVTSNSDQGKEAFQTTIRILNQIRELGITQKEWELAKKVQLRNLTSVDTTKPKYWLEQIQEYYVNKSPLPVNKTKVLEQWFSELSLEDFNKLVREYFSDIVNDIGIIVPHGQRSMYSEDKVREWIEEVLQETPQPYSYPEVPKHLLSPSEVSMLKEAEYQDLDIRMSPLVMNENQKLKGVKPKGVKELMLKNGIKVVLDTLAFNSNKINIYGFSPKGASCFPKVDYFSALNASSIIKNAGVREMDRFELERFLATTSFGEGVFPYITDNETGIKGKSDLEDFEKLLQLIYLFITAPREDLEAFEDWRSMEKEKYFNASGNKIIDDFTAETSKFIGDNSGVLKGVRKLKGVTKTNVLRAYKIYEQLFGNTRDFTFVISGNFSEEKILPVLLKYLGNLPNLTNNEICLSKKSSTKNLPKGEKYHEFHPQKMGAFYNMRSVIYSLRFITSTIKPTTWKEQVKVDVLGNLIYSKVYELRYKDGFSLYNLMSLAELNRNISSYDFEIRLNVDSKELQEVRKTCKEMIREIKNHTFTEARFKEVVRNTILPNYKSKKQSPFHRLQQLHDYYVFNESFINISESEIENFILSLTREDILETARKYLKEENLIEFVMKNKNLNNYP